MMNIFEFLNRPEFKVSIAEFLPLAHSAPARYAESIINSEKLEPSLCSVFKEKLLYFYYGRPAYRKEAEKTSSDKSLVPIVFIVNPNIAKIKRVFPFDSGAYIRYVDKHLSKKAELEKYQLPKSLKSIQSYIHAIYGSNKKYYCGECKIGSDLPDYLIKMRKKLGMEDFDNFLNFISSTNEDNFDDRSYTVEIQSHKSYYLKNNLLAVIVPNYLQQDVDFLNMVKKMNAKPYYYQYFQRLRLNEYLSIIYERANEFYTEIGVL